MAEGTLPYLEQFNVHEDPASVGIRWEKWLRRFDNLLIALGISDGKRQRALLFHYAGSEVADIYDTFPEKEKGKEDEYSRAAELLTQYFLPKKNIEYEVHVFRQAKQMTDETMDKFHTRLRKLAKTCEFTDIDREIKTQIIQGCLSQRLRRRALRETMTLAQLLDYARSFETSETQARGMEKKLQSETTEYINRTTHQPERNKFKRVNQRCYRCNGNYPHVGRACPAKGKTCNFCGKENHFAAVCRKRDVGSRNDKRKDQDFDNQKKKSYHSVKKVEVASDPEGATSSDDEYVFASSGTRHGKSGKHPIVTVTIGKEKVDFIVDTGATVNLIEETDFLRLEDVTLRKSSTRINQESSKFL
jgi:hypothetical protein